MSFNISWLSWRVASMPYQISNFAKRLAWQPSQRHRPSHPQPPPARFCPQLLRSKPDGLEQEFCRACSTGEYLGPGLLKQTPGWDPLTSECEGAEPCCPQSQWSHSGSTLAKDLGPEVSAHHQSHSTAKDSFNKWLRSLQTTLPMHTYCVVEGKGTGALTAQNRN